MFFQIFVIRPKCPIQLLWPTVYVMMYETIIYIAYIYIFCIYIIYIFIYADMYTFLDHDNNFCYSLYKREIVVMN